VTDLEYYIGLEYKERSTAKILMSESNLELSGNTHILLRVLILISTIVLVYFAFAENFRHNIPPTIVVLAILIFIERMLSSSRCVENNKVEGFDRTSRLEWLNAGRGKLGQFYVNCRGCGRKKMLQERVSSLYDQPPCGRYQTVGPCEGCSGCDNQEGCNGCDGCTNPHSHEHIDYPNYCEICRGSGLLDGKRCKDCKGCGGCGKCQRCMRRNRYRTRRFYKPDHYDGKQQHGVDIGCTSCNSGNSDRGVNRSYCIKDCADNIGRDTVSLWNDNYIDTNEIFSYDGPLDLKSKIESSALNYRELPAINGPPGYSVYLDSAYNY
jgi:hypothetical protein